MAAVGKKEMKAWARQHIKGLETVLMPSFTPDLSGLDEEGIRWDVQQCIKHGFFSALAAPEVDLEYEEAKRFVQIAADEAKGKMLISATLNVGGLPQILDFAKHCEKVGVSHLLFWLPPNYVPKDQEELYQYGKAIIEASNLGVCLYTTHKWNWEHLYPSGFPTEVLSRWSDLDNVVALKVGSNDFNYIAKCFRTCGDRILVNTPLLSLSPTMHKAYGQQWVGAATYEIYQTPEKPYAVNFFNLVLQGKYDEAAEVYNQFLPMTGIFEGQMMPTILLGSYHWLRLKYYQWCTGGNGGMIRHPFRIFGFEQMAVKFALSACGIIPREPDEEFFIGRVNYAKMKK